MTNHVIEAVEDRRSAAAQLIIRNAELVEQVTRHTAAARQATRELGELNDRVGALSDELSEANHDRQVLAAENGALRDELEQVKAELVTWQENAEHNATQLTRVLAERADLIAKLDARDMADIERARAAALDSMPDGGV